MTIAGRHDRYDGFGGTTNPKYSFKYQPVDWLAFRGAYSTGFKVPSFAQLFRDSAETQYTNLDLADPAICPGGIYNPQVAGCDVQIQPDILIGGNAALEPEESKQKSFGRSEETTSELQSQMRIPYADSCLKKKKQHKQSTNNP